MAQRRREFLQTGLVAVGTATLGPAFWSKAFAAPPAAPGAGPYGPLGAADPNGFRLPDGFRSRVIARGRLPVEGTDYVWHSSSDGAATFATGDGGWILVSNSEVADAGQGGASAIRFRADGSIADAYRVLGGTTRNCAGGPTPWGTWLSCEEKNDGLVWECDPRGEKPAKAHPAMGIFSHEAVCVDPDDERVYLTEDTGMSGFYRFTPRAYPDLGEGLLEIAVVGEDGVVSWKPVPDPRRPPIRDQVPGFTVFHRGEGIWFDSGTVYVATTGDDRVYTYNTVTGRLEVLYDGKVLGDSAPLHDVDNVTVAAGSGDIFVAEDRDDLNVCIITAEREVTTFLQATGPDHADTEMTGPAFDPSSTRFYVASQRAFEVGAVYEITGPFRRKSRDVTAPDLLLEAPAAASFAEVARRGLLVSVRSAEPVQLSFILRADRRARRDLPGPRGQVLARGNADLAERGIHRTRLRLTKAGRQTLSRRRATSATVTVVAVDRAGNRTTRRKGLVIRAGAARAPVRRSR